VKIFVAGATGVVGVPLVRLLVTAGHEVAGMTRSPGKQNMLRDLGAEPVVCDVYDAAALREAVTKRAPDAVIHELTDLPDDAVRLAEFRQANSRIRREGTKNLLDAAKAADTTTFIAQSIAWEIPGEGGAAVKEHERMVLDAGGVVVRYGVFYGPGTYYEEGKPEPPRVHVDEAARRTVLALEAPSGIITITD
jgi:nucleoside-diphosphate-sugar epimerase